MNLLIHAYLKNCVLENKTLSLFFVLENPLSFAEFYAAYDGDYDDAWEEYMIYGGLPQVAQFSVERQKAEYLKNIFTNVYIKDVVERNRIQNVDEIGTLVDILASAIGAPTNPTKISNTFKSERGINYSNKTTNFLICFFIVNSSNFSKYRICITCFNGNSDHTRV